MLVAELIARKQHGKALSNEEISELVGGFAIGDVPDYQMAAMLMAIYFRGLSDAEGQQFLRAMIGSGKRLRLVSVAGIKVDKHSTGGVGDKTSLIVAPVVAAAGVPVPMISGRALGHTGGTLDKLESIPGFRVRLDDDEFERILNQTGGAFGAQTAELVPADRKMYALRDVTATVSIPPLIAASILSKKIAEGTNALMMDVKIGSGGFLESESDARALAKTLVDWSAAEGVRTIVYGSDMERPLGRTAGNAPEVLECLDILRTGKGDERLLGLCRALGGGMLMLGEKAPSLADGEALFMSMLTSGAGYHKFEEIAAAQGAESGSLDQLEKRTRPRHRREIRASRSGYVVSVKPREVGFALVDLGAGRQKASDDVDHTAGVIFTKQVGDAVQTGELLATAGWSEAANPDEGLKRLERAFEIGSAEPPQQPLLRFYCDETGVRSLAGADGFDNS